MSTLSNAWQGVLSSEQQAVFGYGLLGPYLSATAEIVLAHTCATAHDTLCDAITQAMVNADERPANPPPDYPQLYPMSIGTRALQLAVQLEDEAAAAWRYLYSVASTTSGSLAKSLRPTAQTSLTASAVRAVQWRRRLSPAAATVAFPGI